MPVPFFLTERQSQQLIWSCCINTHGIAGCNISADLFMEHLNRVCKSAVAHLGANKSAAGLKRAGLCVGVLNKLLATFDKELGINDRSGNQPIWKKT